MISYTKKAAVFAAAVIMLLSAGCSDPEPETVETPPIVTAQPQPTATRAYITAEDNAISPNENGEYSLIPGGCRYAEITPNGGYIITESTEGTLCFTSPDGTKLRIAQNAYIVETRNSGCIYRIYETRRYEYSVHEILEKLIEDGGFSDTVEDALAVMLEWDYADTPSGARMFYRDMVGRDFDSVHAFETVYEEYFRFTFEDRTSVPLGRVESIAAAENSLSVIYTADSGIYTLPENSGTVRQIKEYSTAADVYAISDSGALALWRETDRSGKHLLFSLDGDKYGCIAQGVDSSAFFAAFSENGEQAVYCSASGQHLFMKTAGADCVRVNITSPIRKASYAAGYNTLTANGKWDAVYVLDVSGCLRAVHFSGSVGMVQTDVKEFALRGETLCYITATNALYEGANLIAEDVLHLYPTADGSALFYLTRDYDLYYHTEEEEIKISSDVDGSVHVKCDGSGIVFFTDTWSENVYVDGSAVQRTFGTLNTYTIGGGRSAVVMDDVCEISLRGSYTIGSDRYAANEYLYTVYTADSAALYFFSGRDNSLIHNNVLYH